MARHEAYSAELTYTKRASGIYSGTISSTTSTTSTYDAAVTDTSASYLLATDTVASTAQSLMCYCTYCSIAQDLELMSPYYQARALL
jgi:hypothetical protein